MATYYVTPTGSNLNTGLGPDASTGTNKPFATIGKAIGTGGAAIAGDTVYISPGVYREIITIGMTGSLGLAINVIGDTLNSQGFKDVSGNRIPGGEVRMTNYTTNDSTSPSSASALVFTGRSYFNFSNMWLIGGTSSAGGIVGMNFGCTNISFTACMFTQGPSSNAGQASIAINNASQPTMNVLFDRCIIIPNGTNAMQITLNRAATGADYNAGIIIQNCLFIGGFNQIKIISTGAGSFFGGGVIVRNCNLMFSGSATVTTADANLSTSIPTLVNNSVLYPGVGVGVAASASGQIVENYNYLNGRTNVDAGLNSVSDGSKAPLFDFGQWMMWGQSPRAFCTPTVGSPFLGFGNTADAPTYDWLNRTRPEGGQSIKNAIGYLERHDTGAQEGTVVDSGSSLRIVGPGSQLYQIPVNTTGTSISVKCQYDALHGTGTPPQFSLLSSPELGLVDNYSGSGINQIVTAPNATGVWNTLSLNSFTPTSNGVVRVVLSNRSSAPSGNAYFDTFTVT